MVGSALGNQETSVNILLKKKRRFSQAEAEFQGLDEKISYQCMPELKKLRSKFERAWDLNSCI